MASKKANSKSVEAKVSMEKPPSEPKPVKIKLRLDSESPAGGFKNIHEDLQKYRDESWLLELELEAELLKDAVFTARLALQALQNETYNGQRFERRKGLRLKDKALKVEMAFNRLRALRKGDLIPPSTWDE